MYIYDDIMHMRNISIKHCRENHITHFMFNNFFFCKNCAAYEIMFKKIIELQATDDNMIWHMH